MDARYLTGLERWKGVRVEPDKHHEGVFIAIKDRRSLLFTKSMVPSADKLHILFQDEDGIQVEYRACNPYTSKLAAAMYRGIANIRIKPGARVLYLGTPSGETLSHVSDVVGPNGVVYVVICSGKDVKRLVNIAARRPNVIPIIEDPGHPEKYRNLVGAKVDVICSELIDRNQSTILIQNAAYYLKDGGHFLMFTDESLELLDINEQQKKLEAEQLTVDEEFFLCPLMVGESGYHICTVGAYKDENASAYRTECCGPCMEDHFCFVGVHKM